MIAFHTRAALRLSAFLGVTFVLLPFYLLAFFMGRRPRRLFSYLFFKCSVDLAGLRVRTEGVRLSKGGSLFVANHVSYLDVIVMASLIDGIFVAKSEVQGWPLFGFLARISQTIFVSRKAAKISREKKVLSKRLQAGDSIILFPEGSSSCGTGVLPFRPGLLSAVQVNTNQPVEIQPVTLAYGPKFGEQTACDQSNRDRYAWYGDMELLPHLWQVFGSSEGMDILLVFHPPALATSFSDARACAKWAEVRVRDGLRKHLSDISAGSGEEPKLVMYEKCLHLVP